MNLKPLKIIPLGEPDEPGCVRLVTFFDENGRKLGNPSVRGWATPCDWVRAYMNAMGDSDGLVRAGVWLTPQWRAHLGVSPDDWIRLEENL